MNTTTGSGETTLPALLNDGIEGLRQFLENVDEILILLAQWFMDDEVRRLCGDRYKRNKPEKGRYQRHGFNPGSIKFFGSRIRVKVQRVMDTVKGKSRSLESYQLLHQSQAKDELQLTQSIILGLSQRDYRRPIQLFMDSFGLSAASVSRTFVETSAAALEEFMTRDLSQDRFVALMIDGKYLKDRQIVLCMGITASGEKKVLGFIESDTENAEATSALLQDLLARGLDDQEGLLCVIDGAKGLRKAVKDVLGEHTPVQRCTQHKRENVKEKLSDEADIERVDRQMQKAYNQPTYDKAKALLDALQENLATYNKEAANSLAEGKEETLTLHKLGVDEELRKSLRTTNIIENLNSTIGRRLNRIKRWWNSSQRQRWIVMAILNAEEGFKELPGKKHLPNLQAALQKCVPTPYNGESQSRSESPNSN